MIILFNLHAALMKTVNLRLFLQLRLHGLFHLSRLVNLLEMPGLRSIHLEDLPHLPLEKKYHMAEMRMNTTHSTTLPHRTVCPLLHPFPVDALRLLRPRRRSK